MATSLPLEACMASVGLTPSRQLVLRPNQYTRFHVEGDRSGSRNGWLIWDDTQQRACFGSWKTGEKYFWRADAPRLPSHERRQLRHDAYRQQRAQQAEAHRHSLAEAKQLWDAAEPPYGHPYLERKQVAGHGIRQLCSRLLVPLYDEHGNLMSLQLIDESGGKRFHKGAPTKGGFLLLGEFPLRPGALILLCEGYATGATLYELLGLPVVIAFSAGNLMQVADMLRARYPRCQLVICADNDHAKDGNTGLTAANKVANRLRCLVLAPPSLPGITDFNDLFCLQGRDALLALLADSPLTPFIRCHPVILSRDGKGSAFLQSSMYKEIA